MVDQIRESLKGSPALHVIYVVCCVVATSGGVWFGQERQAANALPGNDRQSLIDKTQSDGLAKLETRVSGLEQVAIKVAVQQSELEAIRQTLDRIEKKLDAN